MKYENEILDSFKILGFSPRQNQLEDINKILMSFLDEGFKYVVLSAPTGTGKSIIGAVVAETLNRIKDKDNPLASILLTPTNILSEQYRNTFSNKNDFLSLKGASNYSCEALKSEYEFATGEDCVNKTLITTGDIRASHCDSCLFLQHKKRRNFVKHLVTNYSYFFIERMYTKFLKKRTCIVFDEAHLINDIFTEHNAIFVSKTRLNKMIKEVSDNLTTISYKLNKEIKNMIDELSTVNESNYMDYLYKLVKIYSQIKVAAENNARNEFSNTGKYLKYSKLANKYFHFGCKIQDLFKYKYEHAFDKKLSKDEFEISIKPIFVKNMMPILDNSNYVLLMSGTIGKVLIEETLDLKEYKLIKLPPQFNPENKPVAFYKTQNLNFKSLQEKGTIQNITKYCFEIIQNHKDENGIILAPSFDLCEKIANRISNLCSVFEHKRGTKLGDIVDKFKKSKQTNKVLITPSGFEGLDLYDDLSRFQIIVKAPFASLGDARIKKILDKYPNVYSTFCIMKLVQGAGRSVRSKDDFAITYMLDKNITRLWTSKENEWDQEFTSYGVS